MGFNASSIVSNTCGIICSGILEINSSNFINNLGYLKGAQEVKINSTGTIQLNDHSMISTVNLTYNQGTILGGGALNSIKVTGTFSLFTQNTYVSGLIETACESFSYNQGNQASHFINGATVVDFSGVSNYIPVSGCNPEGHGSLPMQDTDGDGVSDDLDEYPEDYDRAFNSFFPSESSYASLVFEDLWPAKGDYDFNDLVLGVTGYEVTNANNELIDLHINFNVRAVGASLQNGFGWQFAGITPDMIGSVTGAVLEQGYVLNAANGTELGQDSAVIIACENVEDVLHRAGGSMFNTLENGFSGTSDLIEIHVIFDPPINQSLIGPDAYTNVFLIKSQDRSVEVHFPDRVPTDKMNMSLLGTGQDASDINTGAYFKTASGLPWGLLLLEPYDYSVEKSEITQAYLHFAEWAESGGVLFQDWYSNQSSGYRNNIKIYGAQ
jgi:LruC domain-containing protein